MDMKENRQRSRVLVAKIGLDGHNRGAQVVANGLREAGMEVIYTGIRQTPSSVARAAIQEDVDVIGISSMVGAHLPVVKKLMKELEALNAADIPVILGGIIPEEDYGPLREAGVSQIFPPGAAVKEIVQYIESIVHVKDWIPEVPGSLTGKNPDALHLLGSRCAQCGQVYFPPRKNCPQCMSDHSINPTQLSDTGTLQAFAVASVAPPGFSVPHAQGYIDLAPEGPRIFSLLTDYEDPVGLQTGREMGLKIVKLGRDKQNRLTVGYRFRPLKKEG